MFERILLAVDGSDHAKKATGVATDLARDGNAEVTVLHIREVDVGKAAAVAPLETSHDAVELVNDIVHQLHEAGARAKGAAHSAPHGRAAHDIVEEARSMNADLIVMGSRGLSDFAALLLGSVAHKVVQHADCPVLIVR